MPLSVSPTQDDFAVALRAYLVTIVSAECEVFQGQANRVPAPSVPDFVVFTPTGRRRLATNTDTWDFADPDPAAIDVAQPTAIEYQLDLYGPNAPDNAQMICTLTRDYYAAGKLDDAVIQPLYAEDPMQTPFINGQKEWETRWTIKIVLQSAPSISTPQEFAATITTTIIPIRG